MLEGARNTRSGDVGLRVARDRPAGKYDLALVDPKRAGQAVEHRALACAIRADHAENFAGPHLEADVVDGDQSAEPALDAIDLQKKLARRRLLTPGEGRRWLRPLVLCLWQKTGHEGDDALPRPLQEQDEQGREGDDLELAGRAFGQQRQIVRHAVLQEGDDGSPDNTAKQAARSADHLHHQIFDAHTGVEWTRTDEAAHVSVEPSGQRGQKRGNHKRQEPDLKRADAEALDQRVAAAQRAHGPTKPRVQEVVAKEENGSDDSPDQEIDLSAADQRERSDADGRDRRDPVEAAEPVDIAEEKAYRQPPCGGAEREKMALQPQGDETENGGDAAGQCDSEHKAKPGRMSVQCGYPGRRIGRDADKRRLPEGHDSPDTRKQRKADRDEGVDADVIHQRDAERAQDRGGEGKTQRCDRTGKPNLEARHSSISSSECNEARDRQIRIGISREKTITSFSALLLKEAKLSSIPTPTAPIAAPG